MLKNKWFCAFYFVLGESLYVLSWLLLKIKMFYEAGVEATLFNSRLCVAFYSVYSYEGVLLPPPSEPFGP